MNKNHYFAYSTNKSSSKCEVQLVTKNVRDFMTNFIFNFY